MNEPLINTRILEDNERGLDMVKREGYEIDKGVVLTEPYLQNNKEGISSIIDFFIAYPDLFLDYIKPAESEFSLFFYQRIMLRAMMRYKNVYVVACRAASKSFITILAMVLQCIFMPRTKRFICAPFKNQSAQIAKEKLTEIFNNWPLLRREVIGGDLVDTPGNYGKDYVTLKFRNGSVFDVVGASDSTRGGRRHGLEKYFNLLSKICIVL